MKKSEQEWINARVMQTYDAVKATLRMFGESKRKPFRHCSAKVGKTYGYILLYSYDTLVAVIDDDKHCYDFLRLVYGYTATSNQHICKFCNDYNALIRYSYKPV